MENEKVAERKAEQTYSRGAEISKESTTLKIWDVPRDLAHDFIMLSKMKYANKSHLCLRDIMLKAVKFDELTSSGRLEKMEKRLKAVEEFVGSLEVVEEKGEEEPKIPKTFGDKNDKSV